MILEITKEINSEEELLDQNLTSFKEIQEKLDIAQKESVEAELQAWLSDELKWFWSRDFLNQLRESSTKVSALRRRLALADEEKNRVEENILKSQKKYEDTIELISRYETERKNWDERGNTAEDGIEILEGPVTTYL